MKLIKTSLLLVLGLTMSPANAANLGSDKEKLSYSMGIFFGQSITRQDLDLDKAAFMQAVEDVLNGAEMKLTPDQMQQIIQDYQQAEQEAAVATAGSNKEAGMKYLAVNKEKEGVKVTDTGLQYKIIRQGDGAKPTSDSTVLIHYRGTLVDGTEFDSSYARGEPIELGVNRVIQGWQEALAMMPVGSKWEVVVPSDLAYGSKGAGRAIGPNATLKFDIELLEIK